MDKHKQFTKHVHPVGSMVHPDPAIGTAKTDKEGELSDLLKQADLSSDFDPGIDPNATPVSDTTTKVQAKPFTEVDVTEAPSPESNNDDVVAPPPFIERPETDQPTTELIDSSSDSSDSFKKKADSKIATGFPDTVKQVVQKPVVRWSLLGAGLLILIIISVFVGTRFTNKSVQMIDDTAELDKSTLIIDSEKHTVGVRSTTNPDGLQVGATATTDAQGVANIRLGLLGGSSPSLLFEDDQSNVWQLTNTEGGLQFIQGTQGRAKLDGNALSLTNALNVGGQTNANGGLSVAGNTILGNNPANILTVQGTNVVIPNNLNFDANTLFINATTNTVAVGTSNAAGYRLLVAGTLKANSSIFTDGQVLAAPGSAKGPSFTWSNNTTSGLFLPSINVVGVSAGGAEVLRVQQGAVIAIGANLEADGFVRAGRGGNNPAFQTWRYTGTLDGAGSALIGTGVGSAHARVLTGNAYYRGNGDEAVPMSVDYITGSNFRISGGIPGRQYRVTLIFSQDNAGW